MASVTELPRLPNFKSHRKTGSLIRPIDCGNLSLMKVLLAIIFLVIVSVGCTSGPGLVTGYVRPAIEDYRTVRVLGRLPKNAETIASVKASSDSGFSRERNLDHAINELKKKAARLGANALVVTRRNSPIQMGTAQTSGGGLVVTNNEREVVSAIAVWIE